jgi:hypothetical protein
MLEAWSLELEAFFFFNFLAKQIAFTSWVLIPWISQVA